MDYYGIDQALLSGTVISIKIRNTRMNALISVRFRGWAEIDDSVHKSVAEFPFQHAEQRHTVQTEKCALFQKERVKLSTNTIPRMRRYK